MKNFKNKIIVCTSAAALFFSGISKTNAQANDERKAEFGFRLMPTFTSLEMKTSDGGAVSGNVILGFGAGALFGFNFTDNTGIQGELIYSSISQKSFDNSVERKVNLRYINIPLLISLNSGKSKVINLNIVAGPQIGFNIGSNLTISGNSEVNTPQPVLSVKKSDLGFAYGAGVDFGLNSSRTLRLSLGYRGVFGLIDISNKNKTVTTNSYYVLDRAHVKTNSVYIGLSILFL